MAQMTLDGYFKISERGSSVGTEVRAGVTTFLVMMPTSCSSMPDILGDAGLDKCYQWQLRTALVAGILTIAMGVFSNYPIAMAAGLGLNAAVAYQPDGPGSLDRRRHGGHPVMEGIIITVLVVLGLARSGHGGDTGQPQVLDR